MGAALPGGAIRARHPCLEEMVLCNEQCHLLGGAGTMTLWSAERGFLSGFMFVCLGVGWLVGLGRVFFSL